jgi:hypothetical protein
LKRQCDSEATLGGDQKNERHSLTAAALDTVFGERG